MIDLLAEYCRKQGLVAESGFSPKLIRWAICCDANGRYSGLVELGDVGAKNNRGQEFPGCPELSHGEMIGGGVTRSHFLADTADVVLLHSKKGDEPKLAKHGFFVDLLRRASVTLPALVPLVNLLVPAENVEAIRNECVRKKVKPGDEMTFRVESSFPIEQLFWHDWWREFRRTICKNDSTGVSLRRCFVTGELAEPASTHLKIEGLSRLGGIAMGDVLVGFDKDAFCSFRFTKGRNASVSEAGMTSYRAGLNELIKRSSVQVGNSLVACWFKDRVENSGNPIWALLGPPGKADELAAGQRADDFLRSVHTGRFQPLEGNRYYALTLSGARGRVMVRGWMEGSFESLANALVTWFADLDICSKNGDRVPPPPLGRLSRGCLSLRSQRSQSPTERKQADDDQRRFSQSLFQSAMTGSALSDALPARILAFLRPELSSAETDKEDAPLQPNRFAILRVYLVRYFRHKKDQTMSKAITPSLNSDLPSAAYQCGRVLAILAALQKKALGNVGAGVIQRYYASASTNPGLVFGRLIKNAQYHIEKLGPDASGYLEFLLAGTMKRIDNCFPQVLSLQEQGLFGLGYYHQIADLRQKRIVVDDTETPREETEPDVPVN
jgi:CRISPR-associated protein Csd1